MIIISLTTIPPRFKYLYITIESLLNQTICPDKIIIHIPEIYNNYDSIDIPKYSNDKIIINRQTKDYGPITKLLGLYHSELYNNMSNDDIIIVVDDDRIYNNNMIKYMITYHEKYIDKVLTVDGDEIEQATNGFIQTNYKKQPRGVPFKKIGYIDTIHGCNGFVITKNLCPFNNKKIFEINPKNVNYYVDDIVISGFLTLNNVDIYTIPNATNMDEKRHQNDTISLLWEYNKRFKQNTTCVEYFKKEFNIWN